MTTHIIDSFVIPSGIVGRFAAERERDIQRHAEAQHREEVLLKIEAELKEQEVIKTEARRQQRRATVEADWAPTKIKGPVRRVVCDVDHEGFPCPGESFPQMIECSTVSSEASEDTIGTNNFKTPRKTSSSSSGPGIKKSGPRSRRATVETVATEASTVISEQSFQSAWSTLKDSALTVDSALDIEYTNEFPLRTSVLSNSLHASDVFPDNFDDEEDSGKISAPILQKKCKIHEDVELREDRLQMLTEELNALDLSTSETRERIAHLEKQVDEEQGDSVEWLLSSKNKSTSTPPDIEYEDQTDLIEALFADKKNQDKTIDVLLKELDEMRLQRMEENAQKSSNDAQFDMLKCEIMAMEVRRASAMQEKREMEAELHEMRVLLDEANQRAEEAQKRADKKASERVIYQVSCRKCSSKGRDGQMVGTTRGEVKHAVRKLLKRCAHDVVTSSTTSPKKGGGLRSSLTSPLRSSLTKSLRKRSSSVDNTCPEESFIKHLASHVPKLLPKTETDVYKYCKEIVKVEVLRRNNDGDSLHWRD